MSARRRADPAPLAPAPGPSSGPASSLALTANPVAQSALAAPRAGPNKTTAKSVPAFLNKLYNMVNDPTTDDLIRWSDDGDSFFVPSADRFGRELLPRFFKHSNFGSFVRQLNMYGFHKVPHLQQGVLKTDSEETSELLEFSNPNFARSQPDLLCLIKRQKAKSDAPLVAAETALDLPALLTDLAAVRKHQAALSADLKGLQTSNNALWQEAIQSRERHTRHQDTINKILRFLATVFGGTVVGQEGDTGGDGTTGVVVDEDDGSVNGDGVGRGGKGKGKMGAGSTGNGPMPTPIGRRARLLLEDVKGRSPATSSAHVDDDDEEIEEIPAREPPSSRGAPQFPGLARSAPSTAPFAYASSPSSSSSPNTNFVAPDSTASRFTTLPPTPSGQSPPMAEADQQQQYALPPDYLASLLGTGNPNSSQTLEAFLQLQNANANSGTAGYSPLPTTTSASPSLALLPSPTLAPASLPMSSTTFASLYDPTLAPNSLMSDADYTQQISDNHEILQDVANEKEQLEARTAELELAIKNILENLPPATKEQMLNGTVGAAPAAGGAGTGPDVEGTMWGVDGSTGDDDLDRLLAQYVNTNGETTGDSSNSWNPFPANSSLGMDPQTSTSAGGGIYETFSPTDSTMLSSGASDGFSTVASTPGANNDDMDDDEGTGSKRPSLKKRKRNDSAPAVIAPSPAPSEGTRRSARQKKS